MRGGTGEPWTVHAVIPWIHFMVKCLLSLKQMVSFKS